MKTALLLAVLAVIGLTSLPASAAKSYQVTGPVLALTADTITVQKGSEKWEIARGTTTVPDTVKVGSKVTVEYAMTATGVVDKTPAAKAAKPAAK